MGVKHIGEKDFKEEVLKSKLPVAVDFYADWCGPCRMFSPIFEKVSSEYEGRVKFMKLNVDSSPQISANYGVMSIPTLILFKEGKAEEIEVGFLPENRLKKMLDKYATK